MELRSADVTLTIEQAMCRVLASSHEDFEDDSDDGVHSLLYAYSCCFKALVSLRSKGIEFEVDFIVDTVRWKNAYGEIAGICHL